ncbi:ATP synthase subunit AtpR [Tropicimonas sp. TH_r6]|uniref:ATP synthase subunit AtpR n=1 Tax=Tropicimonas sp. TH_r6 TaxID=3082085 RepID=UPI0029542421|nr:ATP synthase subunit AtpR [Tropicimonas sp. TH_r6]MDV7143251.1 ATP synthase subunit AtpR [Tropicimonas sp. TH_r6]
MMPIDWTAIGLGLLVGAGISSLYFAGLALGLRRALAGAHPVAVLVASAALRMAGLLAVGWTVIALAGPWAGLSLALAFFTTRHLAVALARRGSSGAAEGRP